MLGSGVLVQEHEGARNGGAHAKIEARRVARFFQRLALAPRTAARAAKLAKALDLQLWIVRLHWKPGPSLCQRTVHRQGNQRLALRQLRMGGGPAGPGGDSR